MRNSRDRQTPIPTRSSYKPQSTLTFSKVIDFQNAASNFAQCSRRGTLRWRRRSSKALRNAVSWVSFKVGTMCSIPSNPDSTDGNPTAARARRVVPETGSFGKSTRRSRSRTATPAAAKREDPTITAGDAIFGAFIASRAATPSDSPQRKASLPSSVSQPNLSSAGALAPVDGSAGPSSRYVHKEPTEVILRGFKSTQQYAAIHEYERIAGRICEDYPRDPPSEQRRYKADLRDPASLRRRAMTPEEKTKALKFAGGEHWIKVTFESADAADAAVDSSPQTILGHLIYAELYRGVPPTADEAVPANGAHVRTPRADRFTAQTVGPSSSGYPAQSSRRPSSTLPRSFTTPAMSQIGRGSSSISPPGSNSSSHTLDSATLSTATVSSGTVVGQPHTFHEQEQENVFCQKIPTAKKVQLLPAEQALLPQQSYSQRIMSKIPFLNWLSSDIIGSTLPKTENGEFDWVKASMYWKLIYWIDLWTHWFGVVNGDKED